jgi:mRNA interferase MazF
MSTTHRPRRGEIWLVNLDPTVGKENKKKRPAVVISSDAVGRLPVKLCVPITGWQQTFANAIWHVRLEPDNQNNLSKESSCDTLQTRCLDSRRFIKKIGRLSPSIMEDIAAAIAAVIEFQ